VIRINSTAIERVDDHDNRDLSANFENCLPYPASG